ncbi:hypothetical protein BU24DRAFT_434970 [Aaosphaeria arxii CBS 175.79]|uniref:Ras modification protein ERF4 n=1 Tax=Aaosphaeria arxii CBS 175.79 TaxID=1450172 RepID=A0A6A5XI48_9PLEO|nr:uncharacterized protein BU24DRAFT_434970 [Aaosphaeria arxii CBS 175.79]KAF2012491.1 hypothetical protein BU24DRAFT_434970 [Aaosphaeria arxii CBS 175.79]
MQRVRVEGVAQGPVQVLPASASASAPATTLQDPPLPVRWSLTNRIFNLNLNLRALYTGGTTADTTTTTTAPNCPPRQPASRLWNPLNSSPRTPVLPNVPFQHPELARRRGLPPLDTRDEYPLLSLPEQRRSRQSPAPSSLVVERSTGADSSRTSVGLPRDRRSVPFDFSNPGTPRVTMPAGVHNDPAKDQQPQQQHLSPTAITHDPEMGLKRSPSRASLPNSMNSRRSDLPNGEGNADDNESEYAWGPQHPCFPHPNSHVPKKSPLYETTRIIRIKRDWMVQGDLAPTFANVYPEILEGTLAEDDFRDVIQKINDALIDAFNPFGFRAWLDAIMGVATFWLWDDAGMTKIKKDLAELERWIEAWNHRVGEKEGVSIVPLRRTGYLTLDIQIPDPHFETNTASRPNTQDDGFEEAPPHEPYGIFQNSPAFHVTPNSPPRA